MAEHLGLYRILTNVAGSKAPKTISKCCIYA